MREPQTYDAEPCYMQATKLWGARVMDPDAKPGDRVRLTSKAGKVRVAILDSPGPPHRDGGTRWHLRQREQPAPGQRTEASTIEANLAAYRRGALGGMDPDDPLGAA